MVFVGRFIAFLRTFVALFAGANHMEWKTFLLWNALGGVAWATSYRGCGLSPGRRDEASRRADRDRARRGGGRSGSWSPS